MTARRLTARLEQTYKPIRRSSALTHQAPRHSRRLTHLQSKEKSDSANPEHLIDEEAGMADDLSKSDRNWTEELTVTGQVQD